MPFRLLEWTVLKRSSTFFSSFRSCPTPKGDSILTLLSWLLLRWDTLRMKRCIGSDLFRTKILEFEGIFMNFSLSLKWLCSNFQTRLSSSSTHRRNLWANPQSSQLAFLWEQKSMTEGNFSQQNLQWCLSWSSLRWKSERPQILLERCQSLKIESWQVLIFFRKAEIFWC